MDIKTESILITGASGNLGSQILNYFSSKGYKDITACSRHIPDKLNSLPGVTWLSLDILDTIALEDVIKDKSIVIHAAAKVCYQPKEKTEIYKINIEGTANVVNASLNANVKKFIHISSTAGLGISTDHRTLDENYIPDPSQFLTDYALSKWFGELEVWRGISEGLKANIIAPSLILSSNGEYTNTGVYIRKIKSGFSYYPSGTTGIVHSDDVVKAIELLINSDITDEKYILNSCNISWKEFFHSISNKVHLSNKLKPIPLSLFKFIKITNTLRRIFGQTNPVPTGLAKQMMKELKYDGSKITKIEGFNYTSLDDTFNSYINDSHSSLLKP